MKNVLAQLRAYRPDHFKTPGTQVNIATRGDVFVLTEEERHELMRVNMEFLENTPIQTDTMSAHNAKDLQRADDLPVLPRATTLEDAGGSDSHFQRLTGRAAPSQGQSKHS